MPGNQSLRSVPTLGSYLLRQAMSFFRPTQPRRYYQRRTLPARVGAGLLQAVKEIPILVASVLSAVLALAALPLCLLLMPFRDKPEAGPAHALQQGLAEVVVAGVFMLFGNPVAAYFRVKDAMAQPYVL